MKDVVVGTHLNQGIVLVLDLDVVFILLDALPAFHEICIVEFLSLLELDLELGVLLPKVVIVNLKSLPLHLILGLEYDVVVQY